MARNQEKSNTLFSRWSDFKATHSSGPGGDKNKGGRPLLQSECSTVGEAEKWRRDVVRELTKKVAAIANASLGEARIRELNDEINKMQKKKYYWEMRIIDLGGPDHRKIKQHYDVEGQELPGAPGYRYYGAAKELPGVRELFKDRDAELAQRALSRQKRTRADISKLITPDYYGYRDEDDGVILKQEEAQERTLVEAAVREWEIKKRRLQAEVKRSGGTFGSAELAAMGGADGDDDEEEDVDFVQREAERIMMADTAASGTGASTSSSAVGLVPTQAQIEELIVSHKKAALLSAFLE